MKITKTEEKQIPKLLRAWRNMDIWTADKVLARVGKMTESISKRNGVTQDEVYAYLKDQK